MADWHHTIRHGMLTYPPKHVEEPHAETPWHCFPCGAPFPTRQMAIDHLWNAHGVKEIDNSPNGKT